MITIQYTEKMKRTFIWACLLTLGTSLLQAQETPNRHATVLKSGDSLIIRKGTGDMRIKIYEQNLSDGDKEEEIYDGVFIHRVESDRQAFFDALPFIPKRRKSCCHYNPHCTGLFLGFSRMADDFFSFDGDNRAELDLGKSWEIGISLLTGYYQFRSLPNWGINMGLSWGYRSFRFDNRALMKGERESYFVDGDNETSYSKSRLRHYFFRIPVLLEWQSQHRFFINAGPEFEIRHGIKSFARINGEKKQSLGKGMYVKPVGVNLLVQAGYGNIGLYLRYSNPLFQKGKGPDVNPYSFGLAWYW